MAQPALIVFGGLPGVGKTTLTKQLAQHLGAVYLRLDTVEVALQRSGVDVMGEGYAVINSVAEDNLKAGNTVIADCVNPLPITRDAWHAIAARTGAKLVEIEIVCSDKAEHQRRVETRTADITGHTMPTWQDVVDRDYEPWTTKNITLDTAGNTPDKLFEQLLAKLAESA